MFSLDPIMVALLLFYTVFAALCFFAGFKRLWKHYKKKPNLKLIRGGKKENKDG